jgi:hypothetical protein
MVHYINKLAKGLLFIIPFILVSCSKPDSINIFYDRDSEVLSYGAERLADHLRFGGFKVAEGLPEKLASIQIIILRDEDDPDTKMAEEGFRICCNGDSITITGNTARGCLYGIMDLLEQIGPACDLDQIHEKQVNPASMP